MVASQRHTGIAVRCVDANGVRIMQTSCVRTDDEIIALAHSLSPPLTIAIDIVRPVPSRLTRALWKPMVAQPL